VHAQERREEQEEVRAACARFRVRGVGFRGLKCELYAHGLGVRVSALGLERQVLQMCMPYMYALYVCLICMRYICMYVYVCICMHMYASCVCHICMPYMYALYVCMPYMYALYVCLVCVPYMCALYVAGGTSE